LFSQYYQTTGEEKKAPSDTKLYVESITKIILGAMTACVVLQLGGMAKEMVAMSKPGSDEERKA
jgi:hypothetical protein